MKQVGGSGLC